MILPHFSACLRVCYVAGAGWLASSAAADAQTIPSPVSAGGAGIPSPAALAPAGVLTEPAAKQAAALDFARGALVSLQDAHAKTLSALIPAPPVEELWNDVHLPHVLQEPWYARTDDPADPLHSPVSPAIWQLRDMASIHTAPSTHLAPVLVRPPFLYFPVPVIDGVDVGFSAFDSPHFRVLLPKPDNNSIPVPTQKIIEKLEDSLVLMRMMPVHFAKAQARDIPLKITVRLEYEKATRRTAIGTTDNITSIVVKGETVTVRISQNHPSGYEEACVRGLTNYLLHPLLVHPAIKTGFQEILLRTTPQAPGTEGRVRMNAADRKAARLAEREAEKLESELRKLKIPNLVPPVQRTYSFEDTISSLRVLAANKTWDVHSEIYKHLDKITPHQECPQISCDAEIPDVRSRAAAAIITAFFLFGDNGGDPIHLQNYFSSLQLLGSNQQAHARLYHGRNLSSIRSAIRVWASP